MQAVQVDNLSIQSKFYWRHSDKSVVKHVGESKQPYLDRDSLLRQKHNPVFHLKHTSKH